MTLRGENGESAERSPDFSRSTNSGLPVPPPVPAQSGKQGVPSRWHPHKP